MRISYGVQTCALPICVGQLLFPVAVIPANDVADFGVFCHSRNVAIEAWRLLAGAIDRLYGQIGEFERGNAAQIDGTDFGPIGTNAICKGLLSACLDRKSTRLNSSH